MDTRSTDDFSFLTWNMYLGTDVKLLMTSSKDQIPGKVTEAYQMFLATNFPVRVKAMAREIAEKKPDIIGLQEAVLWQITYSYFPNTLDFVQMLRTELKKWGLCYEVAAQNENMSVRLPDSHGNIVHLLDRDVILIRKMSGIKVIHRKEANYKTNLTIDILEQPIKVLRGWSLVDIKKDGCLFRVINTHLETDFPSIQVAQAREILEGPAKTKLPLIVMGDLNSNANGIGGETYRMFTAKGFHDGWESVGKGDGNTCCQDPTLLNSQSKLSQRVDLILYKNGWQPVKAELVGSSLNDKTPTGLWPSDHAGVYAKLKIK